MVELNWGYGLVSMTLTL